MSNATKRNPRCGRRRSRYMGPGYTPLCGIELDPAYREQMVQAAIRRIESEIGPIVTPEEFANLEPLYGSDGSRFAGVEEAVLRLGKSRRAIYRAMKVGRPVQGVMLSRSPFGKVGAA